MTRKPQEGDVLLDKTVGTGVDVLSVSDEGVYAWQPAYGTPPFLITWAQLSTWELLEDAVAAGHAHIR